MLRIGVQSKGILDSKTLEMEDGLEWIKRAGFDCIDFNLDVFLQNSDLYQGQINLFFDRSMEELRQYFTPYLDGAKKHGLIYSQMHAPYPVWVWGKDEQSEYMAGQVIPKCLEIAGFLGIPYVVIHPYKMQYRQSCQEERRQNLIFFKSLIDTARENGVIICLENLYESIGGRLVEGVCADPEEASWYVDTLNEAAGEERFGFCLDTGHLNLVKRRPYETVQKLGRRIKILHLHENDGIEDLHQIPYTFGRKPEDGFHWDGLLRGLREIGYSGVLSFETFPAMNSFPEGVKEDALKVIAGIGRYFSERIEMIGEPRAEIMKE